jgi:hypothetical protein
MTAKPVKKAVPKKTTKKVAKPRRKYAPGEPRDKGGRPEINLTEALFYEILGRYTLGDPIVDVCDSIGLDYSTFILKVHANSQFSELYARARPAKADGLIEHAMKLTEVDPPMTADGRIDSGWVNWNNTRVNARLKAAALIAPPMQKQEISGKDGNAPFVIAVEVRK